MLAVSYFTSKHRSRSGFHTSLIRWLGQAAIGIGLALAMAFAVDLGIYTRFPWTRPFWFWIMVVWFAVFFDGMFSAFHLFRRGTPIKNQYRVWLYVGVYAMFIAIALIQKRPA